MYIHECGFILRRKVFLDAVYSPRLSSTSFQHFPRYLSTFVPRLSCTFLPGSLKEQAFEEGARIAREVTLCYCIINHINVDIATIIMTIIKTVIIIIIIIVIIIIIIITVLLLLLLVILLLIIIIIAREVTRLNPRPVELQMEKVLYIYIYIYIYKHICICICIHTHTYISIYLSLSLYIYIYILA